MRAVLAGVAALDAQRGMLFCWVPVCLGLGIGLYLAAPVEPSVELLAGLAVVVVAALAVLRRWLLAYPVILGALLVLAGLLLAAGRAHLVSAPILGFRYYGPVTGRIVIVDRSASEAVRLTLDRVELRDMAPDRVPERVRVSLHGDQGWIVPEPGMRVMMTAHLSPPAGPVEPGGFDFQRHAWFDRLGAIGYTRTPVLAVSRGPPGAGRAALERVRHRASTAIQEALPGERGAFAAAIMVGNRSNMGAETLAALRASNLAHLLAISGLHMGLLTGFIFMAVRLALALVPGWALRYPIKSWAAVVALLAGAVYLALSGGNVATQRAFIMASVVLVAVILGRRALTLRAVAVAATIVLALRPESLAEPGFQMSFAATAALVAVFRALRDLPMHRVPRWLNPVVATVVSSAVAGAATAPIAAAHFNIVSHYGLVANLVSVPLMGTVVMPLAVLTACLSVVGLGAWGLALMSPAIGWILGVARWVSDLDGAVGRVPSPQGAVLPLLALGLLVVILWQGRGRWAGVVPAVAALLVWTGVERPPLLVSESGALLGVLTPEGRALSRAKGDGFTAASWLENDGDGAAQDAAAARGRFSEEDMVTRVSLDAFEVAHVRGKSGLAKLPEVCGTADLVIVQGRVEGAAPCPVIDWAVLARRGTLAVYPGPGAPRLVGAREAAGQRLWSDAR